MPKIPIHKQIFYYYHVLKGSLFFSTFTPTKPNEIISLVSSTEFFIIVICITFCACFIEYVKSLQKPVPASYSKGMFPQYACEDGTKYNVNSDLIIRDSEVDVKIGTKVLYNSIVGRNCGTNFFCSQIPYLKNTLQTSLAPVFL